MIKSDQIATGIKYFLRKKAQEKAQEKLRKKSSGKKLRKSSGKKLKLSISVKMTPFDLK